MPECFEPWKNMTIQPEGNVFPCSWAPISVGSINDASLDELWNSERMQEYRNKLLKKDYSICSPGCPLFLEKRAPHPYNECYQVSSAKAKANIALNKDELGRGGLVLKSKPQYMNINITNRCNMKCIMCYLPADRKNMEIPLSISGQLEKYYPYLLDIIFSGGEPFLRTDWLKKLPHSRNYPDLGISFITNASLFNDATLRTLENVPLRWIIVSIDAATKKTYEKIRVGASWEKTMSSLKKLIAFSRAQKNPFRIIMDMTVIILNYPEIPQFIGMGKDLGVAIQMRPVSGEYHGQNIFASPEQIKKFKAVADKGLEVINEINPEIEPASLAWLKKVAGR